ncbi:phospholipase D-like protein [Algoriphagus aquaeductus]|uniref:phospholipase D n=1 Tax=Algoriphagus aquaeductus TaxID=475299 RepID=A0A326RLR8_9BACT|nr:phospholipase D-like domain-containing protein [Algoriphagus aquaeductus]PZV75492.1 phospholipase D-like protein [Algoriphagus aquaeductus]
MKVTEYFIDNISPHIIGYGKGKDLVKLFNQFGFKDIYSSDKGGLPYIGKKNGQPPSKTEYVKDRLNRLSSKNDGSLRDLLNIVINKMPEIIDNIQGLLNDEGYVIEQNDGTYNIQGGVIMKAKPVINEAHFQEIQNRILTALDKAKISIWVVYAWLTNKTLYAKLLDKQNEGLDVRVAIFDDSINAKYGVDITMFHNHYFLKGTKGGIMHHKFCVIDNQVVITGSYNWSNNAEFRNDENVTVEHNPEQATNYSLEYRRLVK